jgi:hypothetical protein
MLDRHGFRLFRRQCARQDREIVFQRERLGDDDEFVRRVDAMVASNDDFKRRGERSTDFVAEHHRVDA